MSWRQIGTPGRSSTSFLHISTFRTKMAWNVISDSECIHLSFVHLSGSVSYYVSTKLRAGAVKQLFVQTWVAHRWLYLRNIEIPSRLSSFTRYINYPSVFVRMLSQVEFKYCREIISAFVELSWKVYIYRFCEEHPPPGWIRHSL